MLLIREIIANSFLLEKRHINKIHFLAFKEVEALHAGLDAGSYRRAARDFLLRHPAKWMPRALAKLDKVGAPPFWHGLLSLVAAFCRADASYLEAVVGPMKA